MRLQSAFAALALSLGACVVYPDPALELVDDGGTAPNPLTILTRELPNAVVGADYAQHVRVRGGTHPYGFQLDGGPPPWLSLNPVTGQLHGRPTAAHAERPVEVVVRDTSSSASSVAYRLRATPCQPGLRYACSGPVGAACWTGTKLCQADGTFGACDLTAASDDESRCGGACGPCGRAGLACVDGRCSCAGGNLCGPADVCCMGAAGNTCSNLASDVNNCGQCGAACTVDPGLNRCGVCTTGKCAPAVCCPGFAECDGATRPCVGTTGNVAHCGACGNHCVTGKPQVVTAECRSSRCVITGCASPFLDCDRDGQNGCEVNPIDNSHGRVCGNLGQETCDPAKGDCAVRFAGKNVREDGWNCVSAVCKVKLPTTASPFGGCVSGWFDCDGNPENGCEQQQNNLHCGSCGDNCNTKANATAGTCNTTTRNCGAFTCNTGFADCDGVGSNGCETNLLTDNANCGSCGRICGTNYTCSSGNCVRFCGGACSGTVCREPEVCTTSPCGCANP